MGPSTILIGVQHESGRLPPSCIIFRTQPHKDNTSDAKAKGRWIGVHSSRKPDSRRCPLGGLASERRPFRQSPSSSITKGDAAILRFLAAAEILETDLWQQYAELGGKQDKELRGLTGGSPLYTLALGQLDEDMDNTSMTTRKTN